MDEKVKTFHRTGVAVKDDVYDGLDAMVNDWLSGQKNVKIVARHVSLSFATGQESYHDPRANGVTYLAGYVTYTVTIFYRPASKKRTA